jgi:hypothetical protein
MAMPQPIVFCSRLEDLVWAAQGLERLDAPRIARSAGVKGVRPDVCAHIDQNGDPGISDKPRPPGRRGLAEPTEGNVEAG